VTVNHLKCERNIPVYDQYWSDIPAHFSRPIDKVVTNSLYSSHIFTCEMFIVIILGK
jgi:hypothetical protein